MLGFKVVWQRELTGYWVLVGFISVHRKGQFGNLAL